MAGGASPSPTEFVLNSNRPINQNLTAKLDFLFLKPFLFVKMYGFLRNALDFLRERV